MPLFSRQRGRTRRVSFEKTHPPDMPGGVNGARVKGMGSAVLLGVLFGVLLVLVVVTGHPPLRYSPGDVAGADVHARVAFEFIDVEKARQARDQAWLKTPNVYVVDNDSLAGTEASLVRMLEDLRTAPDAKAGLAGMEDELPIPQVELPTLVANLRQGEATSAVRKGLRKLFDTLFAAGIMSDERKLAEQDAVSPAVILVSKSRGNGIRRQSKTIEDVAGARRRVDDLLAGNLGVGLSGTTEALKVWLKGRLEPTLTYDEAATLRDREMAKRSVPDQWVRKEAGEVLVARGRVGLREYDMLEAEQAAFLSGQSPADWWKRVGGISMLVGTAFVLGGLYLKHYQPRVLRSRIRMTVLGLLVIVMVLAARFLLHSRWVPHGLYLVPVGFAAMILSLAYDRKFACGVVLFIVLMVGLAMETEAEFRPLLVLLAGGLVAALYTFNIRKRTRLLKVGVLTGVAHMVTIYGVGLGQVNGLEGLRALSAQAAVGLANGIGVGFLITGLLPFLEPLFRITTDISLLELGDLNQPVLKSFALRAPGSYNHSLSVAALAEAAARAIGADDLLVRVGSYFHDIGKINKPHYFVENQGDQGSRHDGLSPQMSALIILAHAKDGLELGRELGLPRPILDVIAEHHGTTLVEYFYKRACEEAGEGSMPDERIFRYGGPEPRSKESAIVMLADSVESASRTLSDPAPARIRNLVHSIVETKLADGQLEECDLTLRELHGIEQSLSVGLISIFHGRIEY